MNVMLVTLCWVVPLASVNLTAHGAEGRLPVSLLEVFVLELCLIQKLEYIEEQCDFNCARVLILEVKRYRNIFNASWSFLASRRASILSHMLG